MFSAFRAYTLRQRNRTMTRTSPFAFIALAFAAGVWLASQFAPAQWLSALVAAIALLGLILTRKHHEYAWASAVVMLVALGALRYQASQPVNTTGPYNGKWVVLEGTVAEEPDARPDTTYLRV